MNDSINLIEILKNIPNNVSTTVSYIPTALTGVLVVMAELVLLAVAILVISKLIRLGENAFGKKKTAAEVKTAPAPAAAAGTPLPDGQSAGKLDLVDVDEPTAAVIMAIVSDRSGIPLNRLNFKSIKRIEE
ncbi:MAG: OadG family protein [Acutalibacteraceae bacterium]